MIPINKRYIYHFTEKDFEKYPNEKLHTGTFWKEGKLHDFFLYYNDKPILRTHKYWVKEVKEHRDMNGKLSGRTLGEKTMIDIFDMDDNKLDSVQIKIVYAHNQPEHELPQVENLDCVKALIRQAKIDNII